MRTFVAAVAAAVIAVAASLVIPSPSAAADPIGQADIQRWSDAWNSHDIDKVAGLFSPDVTIYQPENPKPLDHAGLRSFFSMIFSAYPDFHIEVQDALIDGYKAATFERVTGTWSGPFTDPATGRTTPGNGRSFDHPGVRYIVYNADHTIREVRIYWDRLTVDQQLGITP
jgi:steroid delta-isomerase-like uncharacterized protein